jgi:hypothetical protein
MSSRQSAVQASAIAINYIADHADSTRVENGFEKKRQPSTHWKPAA